MWNKTNIDALTESLQKSVGAMEDGIKSVQGTIIMLKENAPAGQQGKIADFEKETSRIINIAKKGDFTKAEAILNQMKEKYGRGNKP